MQWLHATVLAPHCILADLPVSAVINELLAGRVELLPWTAAAEAGAENIEAVYTYGHPTVDAALLGRLPAVRVISNFGVGVDHIDVRAATARGIPVGNTPGILDGATALPLRGLGPGRPQRASIRPRRRPAPRR